MGTQRLVFVRIVWYKAIEKHRIPTYNKNNKVKRMGCGEFIYSTDFIFV